ncbi:MAG TPA: lysylphosphatidylglycerol synthase transmembrane domain-containing protein [Drouetiella sp.]
MSETKRPTTFVRWQTATLTCVVAALLVKLVFYNFDTKQLETLSSTSHLVEWMAIAVFVYIGGFILRGMRLRWLIELDCQCNLLTAMNVIMIGHALNCIAPFRLGEPVQAGVLSERTGLSFVQSLSVVALQRLFDLLAIVVILLIATSSIPLQGFMVEWRERSIEFCLMFSVAAIAMASVPRWALNVTSMLTYKVTPSVHKYLIVALHDILRALRPFNSLSKTTRIFALSIAVWSTEALFFGCVMVALSLPFSPRVAAAVMSYTNLSIAFPTAPAFSGQYQLSSVHSLLTLFATSQQINVDALTASHFAALVHITFLTVTSTWGLTALASYVVRKGNVVLSKLETQPLVISPEEPIVPLEVLASTQGPGNQLFQPAPFWYALAESLVGENHVQMVNAERTEIFGETVRFMLETLSALPMLLRLQLWVGIAGFRCITGVMHLRRFTGMTLEQRCGIVRNWAEGPIPVFRKLFRPLRSLALLGFFESTKVQEALRESVKREAISEIPRNG